MSCLWKAWSLTFVCPCFRPGMRYSTLSRALHDPAMQVFCVDWSPDGSGIASGGKDHVIKLWRH